MNAEEAYEEMIRQEQESRRRLEDDDASDRTDPADKDHPTCDDAATEAETAEAEAAEVIETIFFSKIPNLIFIIQFQTS